jgi:hypothetical protein
MTKVEGHRSFDLRLFVDCSVPRSTHRSSFRRTLLRWRRREFRLLRRWKGGESFALPYHRGRPVDRGGALPSEGRGREFESRRVRQLNQWLKENYRLAQAVRGSAGEASRTISGRLSVHGGARASKLNPLAAQERFFRHAVSSNLALSARSSNILLVLLTF